MRYGVSHVFPFSLGERLGCAAKDILLLLGDVVAVIDEVGGGRHLDFSAGYDGAIDYALQQVSQRFAGLCDDTVFLMQSGQDQLQVRAVLLEMREGDVFAGVVGHVGVVAQVSDDVQIWKVRRERVIFI